MNVYIDYAKQPIILKVQDLLLHIRPPQVAIMSFSLMKVFFCAISMLCQDVFLLQGHMIMCLMQGLHQYRIL